MQRYEVKYQHLELLFEWKIEYLMCWCLTTNGNLHILIFLVIVFLKARVLSLILKQKVFCFGSVFFWKGNSSCPVWEVMRSEQGLLTYLWETK